MAQHERNGEPPQKQPTQMPSSVINVVPTPQLADLKKEGFSAVPPKKTNYVLIAVLAILILLLAYVMYQHFTSKKSGSSSVDIPASVSSNRVYYF